ncbi:acyltransferase family protein [Sphingomonas sp. Leaf20]|uniref:acyltransferase family protein n=1 Tax=Sphingomonas sp. Leaf20 TaxID=1735685 RepID=UPI0007000B85|nr:acyltransferase [Sphingomonas sp. Leaf20]KQM72169.1 hypothetical protein ASE72_12060 [Sphingomonas sp. Leaf20]
MNQRFNEIVGLRFYLAVWVAVGHGMRLAGYADESSPVTSLLLNGDAAVVIFMIISGFVIAHLIATSREAYVPYIIRRFFRLYPAFVVCSLLGYFLIEPWAQLTAAAPWSDEKGWTAYANAVEGIATSQREHLAAHLFAHATMLHGMIPREILPYAARTFLPAAWSISLEWQFYLIAPLILAACRSSRGLTVLTVTAAALYALAWKGLFGHFLGLSFIAMASPYFAIGIASRLAFPKLVNLPVSPLPAAVLAVSVAISLTKDAVPLAIWGAFYSYLLWQNNDRLTGRMFRLVTTPKPLFILGEASYSLYLLHRPIQVILAVILAGAVGASQRGMLAVQLIAIPIAALFSLALFFGIEKPFMKFAKRVTVSKKPVSPAEIAATGP